MDESMIVKSEEAEKIQFKVFSWDEKFELTQIQISCWKKRR